MPSNIHIAFRFHGNFYHSYRGDTPDELGFGKDIRIIRRIIEVLDDCNRRGVAVCGTWDFENYFSLEKIMPEHCPDIIAALKRRAREGRDEFQLMSYNNGLINAHTAREFEAAVRRGLTNPAGSGLRDLFGDAFEPMVRPQEMMFTPIHLKLYRACGVDAISLYYSALPFNGFSNFIPVLSLQERYNPLTLTYPGINETMTLMPCYNVGDLADHLTLRRWVQQLRRAQLAMDTPGDLLLLLDQDADDPLWYGYDAPGWLKQRLSTLQGLGGLIENIRDLDYIRFTTPGRYLKDHPPVRSISFGQDTADGSFDGLSSWAEKWSNHRLFTGLERARILELQTLRLLGNREAAPEGIRQLLEESFDLRVKILSTTHFGMSAPVMNLTRERAARNLVQQAVDAAAAAFQQAVERPAAGTIRLLDYARGDSTGLIQYAAHPSRGLVRLPLRESAPKTFTLKNEKGEIIPAAILTKEGQRELLFVDQFTGGEERRYLLDPDSPMPEAGGPVKVTADAISNGAVEIRFDQNGQVSGLTVDGKSYAGGKTFESAIVYGGKTCRVERWEESESQAKGAAGWKHQTGSLTLPGGHTARFEREILVAADLPYVYITLRVAYPRTPDQGYKKSKALRLQQAWDHRWKAVLPCEIRPDLTGMPEHPLQVWKHNFCDHLSSYSLDYSGFSRNRELDDANNQITHGWVAVTDGEKGLLVAQNADQASSVAFCPLRTRLEGGKMKVRLNPFGSYDGRQYDYATADTHLGTLLTITFSAADQIKPYAPSYNGRIQVFSLMLAPYAGNRPPEPLRYDAEAFAYPYAVLNDERFIAEPAHRSWEGSGLGEALPPV
ncbi:MAG TPA: hypothetical protein PKW33_18660 [Anaerolineaceae bacterium]|nr:hypothetical protein [Anaerolineaceae bacterium]HPN53624.1 hypothetical protein [Anaerolineaceae bacterium]